MKFSAFALILATLVVVCTSTRTIGSSHGFSRRPSIGSLADTGSKTRKKSYFRNNKGWWDGSIGGDANLSSNMRAPDEERLETTLLSNNDGNVEGQKFLSAGERVRERVLSSNSNVIPISIGPDFTEPFSDKNILRGFKVNIASGESPFKQKVFEGETFDFKFDPSYSKSTIIQSTEDLQEMMEIGGALRISYGPTISGRAAGRYIDKKISNKNQVTILYRTRHMAYAKSVDVGTLKPVSGIESLSPDKLADTYGTKFVETVMYGAQLDVYYTLTTSEDTDLFNIAAELEGSIATGPLSIEFQADFELIKSTEDSSLNLEIVAKASGVTFTTPSNPSPSTITDIIDNFNTKYEDLVKSIRDQEFVDSASNVLNHFGPVAFSLGSTADYLTKLNAIEAAVLDDRMNRMSDIFFSSFALRSELIAARGIQKALYIENPRDQVETYQPYEIAIDAVIDSLQDQKVEECLEYRRLPFASIVGLNGDEPAPVPEQYPKTKLEKDIINGLLGEAYIPSPVKLGSITFDGLYYQGFALPTVDDSGDVVLKPWMNGEIREDDNNKALVAEAMFTDELEAKTYAHVNHIDKIGHNFVRYNESIFFQSNAFDSRWLVPKEGSRVSIDNAAWDDKGSWIIKSDHDTEQDPKRGQCVKYGDKILVQEAGTERFLLATANGEVQISAKQIDAFLRKSRWIITSEGTYSEGQCVQIMSKVHLEWYNGEADMKLLEASRDIGGLTGINTKNDAPLLHFQEWILRSNTESGKTSDGFVCGAISAKGKWAPLLPLPNTSTGSINIGKGIVDRSNPPISTWQQTSSWERSVTASISGGFKAVVDDSVISPQEVDVDFLYGSMLAKSAENAMKKPFHSHFCWKQGHKNPGMKWSTTGPIKDMKCTQIIEPLSSSGFRSELQNYLCVPPDSIYDFRWSVNKGNSNECVEWTNYRGWGDNFLCALNTKPSELGTDGLWWPDDFCWSSEGEKPEGYNCINIQEPASSHEQGWNDNYFCWKEGTNDPGFRWAHWNNYNYMEGMRCTRITEPNDPDTWTDNYLCVPNESSLSFEWSHQGPINTPGKSCIMWNTRDDHEGGWHDNFLCATSTGYPMWPNDYKWSEDGVPYGYDCLEIQHGGSEEDEEVALTNVQGQTWQFQYEIEDMCDSSWTLKVADLVNTPSSTEQPCCLPGMELDSKVPHGPCKLDSPCLCDDSICTSISPKVYEPSIPTFAPANEGDTTDDGETPGNVTASSGGVVRKSLSVVSLSVAISIALI